MDVMPFKAEHALALDLQAVQERDRAHFKPEHMADLEKLVSYTAAHEGKPLMCFGWASPYPGRALIWCLLDKSAGQHMVVLTRIAKEFLTTIPHRRIEAEVEAGFDAGRRWMEILGMRCETPTPLRAYNINGTDSYIYAKVN